MAHRSRVRKQFKITPLQLINDSNVLHCGEKLNQLINKYGRFVFGVAATIFWENLPGRVMQVIENMENNEQL